MVDNQRTLRTLDFLKIRDLLSGFAISDVGKNLCKELLPSHSLAEILKMQDETEEAIFIIDKTTNPIVWFEDVTPQIVFALKGGSLSPRDLLRAARLLSTARKVHTNLIKFLDVAPIVSKKASELLIRKHLEEAIFKAILSEEEISDLASSDLSNIRRQIRLANERVREKLNKLIRTNNRYLQESIVTMRNDRYVLPVKQEFRSMVPGLVHDQSSTGATIFIEPMDIVNINNELKDWIIKERIEIERILKELSKMVAAEELAFTQNIFILKELDVIFAKALFSASITGVRPEINDLKQINIIQGRHPLIDKNKVVPINLWMGKNFSTLVITGPNTGGKTVTLKTVGLLTLMMQSGLQVPASIGTQLSVFSHIFTDIGDEQSIEQSLSTFSSHMTNIVSILKKATPNDLILFDELGAGTDPTEGAALAQSILHTLLEEEISTIATTHYSELKAFALATKKVKNASVEFDINTLRPTFKLSIGMPGKSNAFEISKKLGLSEIIIQKARELITQQDLKFEDVISRAERLKSEAFEEREKAKKATLQALNFKRESESIYTELKDKRESYLKKSREEARRIILKAKQEVDEIINDLKKNRDEGLYIKEHELQGKRKIMDKHLASLRENLSFEDITFKPPANLSPGDQVQIPHLNTTGLVLSPPDERGNLQVQAGILKVNTNISNLKFLAKNNSANIKNSQVNTYTNAMIRNVPLELDIRGYNVDEAIGEIDIYLDEAILASLKEVSLIHGKGTGLLRAGVHKHLRKHSQVQDFRLGLYGEGEAGVTIVKLK